MKRFAKNIKELEISNVDLKTKKAVYFYLITQAVQKKQYKAILKGYISFYGCCLHTGFNPNRLLLDLFKQAILSSDKTFCKELIKTNPNSLNLLTDDLLDTCPNTTLANKLRTNRNEMAHQQKVFVVACEIGHSNMVEYIKSLG